MNIKLVGIDRYGMVEDDFGAEYFWKLWNEIYDSVEIEAALSGPEDDEDSV